MYWILCWILTKLSHFGIELGIKSQMKLIFIDEMKNLKQNGIKINGQVISININAILCDDSVIYLALSN